HERKSPKKAGVSHKIPRQGAGQVLLVGGPNGGKSRILTRLTRATPEVAAYLESYLSSMVRSADACLLVVDLGDDDGPLAAEAVLERLAQVKTILVGQ